MLFNKDGKLKGYEYPQPSVAGMTIRNEKTEPPRTLSREDTERVKQSVRGNPTPPAK